MTTVEALLLIFILHYIGDFLLQTNEMAVNKSTSNKWLTLHVVTYSLPFLLISPLYALINGVLHWWTDYTTSRLSSYYYKKDNRSMFFKVIGFDQLLHALTLIATYHLLVNEYEYIVPWFI